MDTVPTIAFIILAGAALLLALGWAYTQHTNQMLVSRNCLLMCELRAIELDFQSGELQYCEPEDYEPEDYEPEDYEPEDWEPQHGIFGLAEALGLMKPEPEPELSTDEKLAQLRAKLTGEN